jgi:hypothetical protein
MSLSNVDFTPKDKNVLAPVETKTAKAPVTGFADATLYTISACIDGVLSTFQVYGPKNQ